MRKVLIIDDEKWIRRGLIQSLPWDRYGLTLAGEAADGEEGLELALAARPDLIFLDMRMPGLEGKDLLGLFHQSLPGSLVMVVSGYSDFEYTKEAIRQKAFDYLLKPVKKEDLAAVVARAVEELDRRDEERRRADRETGPGWLRRLMLRNGEAEEAEGAVPPASGLPSSRWENGGWAVMAGQPDRCGCPMDAGELADRVREKLDRLQPFVLGGSWGYGVLADAEARLLAVAIEGCRLDAEALDRIARAVQAAVRTDGAKSGGFSLGVSGVKPDPSKLPEACREAKTALRSKLLGEAGVILYADARLKRLKAAYPQEKEDSFLLSLQSGQPEAAQAEFQQWLLAAAGREPVSVGDLQQHAVQLVHAVERLLQAKETGLAEWTGHGPLAYAEMLGRRNDTDSVRSVFTSTLIPPVAAYYARQGEKQGEKIVEELKKRIETQYAQPLSLHQIAAGYYMNADYLSRLFKKVTGTNFVDYMTDVRISKSKELMKLTRCKNYEIARMVGYEDYRYFSQIFKKRTGMTIGEYRSAEGLGDH